MSRLSFIIFNLILFLKNSEAQQKESSVVKETNLDETRNKNQFDVDFVAGIKFNPTTVNCVRFSPNGVYY